jgi:hypothetical protein
MYLLGCQTMDSTSEIEPADALNKKRCHQKSYGFFAAKFGANTTNIFAISILVCRAIPPQSNICEPAHIHSW